MFRAHRAHHQERQIVSIQPLVTVILCRWPCRVQVGSELLASFFRCLGRTKISVQVRGLRYECFATRYVFTVEDHPLSAVRDCFFNILAATLHIGGRSSIHNLRMLHAMVTRTHSSRGMYNYYRKMFTV
jgi:hypothetical protein